MLKVEIYDRLKKEGERRFNAPATHHKFTGVVEADIMMNDLVNFPNAFVFGCVMDRQLKAEKAWLIPYNIRNKLGGFSMSELSKLSLRDIKRIMSRPQPLHRFVDIMSGNLHSAIKRISDSYRGDASNIWSDRPSSAEVVFRFLEFDGVGPKIATMAANILARTFKVQFSDYASIDVSADVHVRRVFGRLGLCSADATIEQVIYKARALNPEFPGIVDSPAFDIGRTWCHATDPMCDACYMQEICPFNLGVAKIKRKKIRENQ